MPQFDFAFFLPQMAWLAAMFAILYFVVVRTTLPKVGKVMQEREDTVTGDLKSAGDAKAEADAVSEAYQAELRKIQDEARAMVAAARSDAQRSVEGQLAAVDADIAGKAGVAQAALEDARARAAGEIEAIASDAAGAIVERLTGVRPAADKANAAAKSALERI